MIPVNRTYAPVQAFVDELARCGMRHAVTSPGSRNAPLALTLAGDERISAQSVLDERSAGFVALGLAKATRQPVAVTCTSGTAAANLLPAVVEATEARVPLIVLTADRPPELREVGAGQSIDQIKLYGDHAKWFVEVGNHEPGRASAVHHRALACRAFATAAGGRPGPVHLNWPLREPLAPVQEQLDAEPWEGRPGGRPWVSLESASGVPDEGLVAEVVEAIGGARRGAIVCGESGEEIATAAAALAATAGWPLLADPLSGVRCGPHDRSHVVARYDSLLRDPGFAAAHRPELVVRLGDTPTSKPLRAWLEDAGRQVVVDPHAAWHEPTRTADLVLRAGPAATCEALAAALGSAAPTPLGDASGGAGPTAAAEQQDWLSRWLSADALVGPALAEEADPFEPKMWAALADAFPVGATLWLSSSMPVRDVEAFFPSVEAPLRFLANRGANGIDGVVSSVLGAALAGGGPAVLLTGELALLHDLGGLLAARRLGAELTIVCADNGGGGIFDFLPVAEHADRAAYEQHVATPAGVDLAGLAAALGLRHTRITTPAELRAAVGQPGVIEFRTDRERNVEQHRAVAERVSAALRGSTAAPAGR